MMHINHSVITNILDSLSDKDRELMENYIREVKECANDVGYDRGYSDGYSDGRSE